MKSTTELVTEIMATSAPFNARLAEAFEAIRSGEDLHMDDECSACFDAIEAAADKAPTRKVKIWTMAVDEENGLQSRLFTTEQARDAAIWDWLAEFNEDEEITPDQLREKYEGDYALAYQEEFQVPMAVVYMNWGDQEIEIDLPTPQHMTALADRLDAGADMDIFYDADDRDDPEGVAKIAKTQAAMREAAQVLRGATPLHVKVEVSGGVAEITECSEGVIVELVDHDNDKDERELLLAEYEDAFNCEPPYGTTVATLRQALKDHYTAIEAADHGR